MSVVAAATVDLAHDRWDTSAQFAGNRPLRYCGELRQQLIATGVSTVSYGLRESAVAVAV